MPRQVFLHLHFILYDKSAFYVDSIIVLLSSNGTAAAFSWRFTYFSWRIIILMEKYCCGFCGFYGKGINLH